MEDRQMISRQWTGRQIPIARRARASSLALRPQGVKQAFHSYRRFLAWGAEADKILRFSLWEWILQYPEYKTLKLSSAVSGGLPITDLKALKYVFGQEEEGADTQTLFSQIWMLFVHGRWPSIFQVTLRM